MAIPFKRLALLMVSLAVVASLAMSLRSSVLTADADKAVKAHAAEGTKSPPVREAFEDFDRARAYNNDAEILLLATTDAIAAKNLGLARRLAYEAARREPENFEAWVLLYSIERVDHPARAAVARRRALRLNPRAERLFRRR
ncbi:MAG TPA: hypothetical protein VEX39_07030 [Thermoleophilaceae bacterium]|nr:hypothetical protein [Thermoleophilaceae bacterium]